MFRLLLTKAQALHIVSAWSRVPELPKPKTAKFYDIPHEMRVGKDTVARVEHVGRGRFELSFARAKCPSCTLGALAASNFTVELPGREVNGRPAQVSYPSTRLACNRCEYVGEEVTL